MEVKLAVRLVAEKVLMSADLMVVGLVASKAEMWAD